MNTLFTILTVLVIIAAVLLVIVVLLQNGKGEGLASNFVAGNQTFGVRQTADILEKVTWSLVAFILVISIAASFTTKSRITEFDASEMVEQTEPQNVEFPSAPIQSASPEAEAE